MVESANIHKVCSSIWVPEALRVTTGWAGLEQKFRPSKPAFNGLFVAFNGLSLSK